MLPSDIYTTMNLQGAARIVKNEIIFNSPAMDILICTCTNWVCNILHVFMSTALKGPGYIQHRPLHSRYSILVHAARRRCTRTVPGTQARCACSNLVYVCLRHPTTIASYSYVYVCIYVYVCRPLTYIQLLVAHADQ